MGMFFNFGLEGRNNMKVVISNILLNNYRKKNFADIGYHDEGLYLFQDSSWNDYGCSSHFIMVYYPSDSSGISPIEIGWIKLCPDSKQMTELYNRIVGIPKPGDSSDRPIKDTILDENSKLCSCPMSLHYYFKLYETLKNDMSQVIGVLELLGDITQLSDEQIKDYELNYIYMNSILRNDSVSSPNMIRFSEIINNAREYIDSSTSTINIIINFYEVLSKSDLTTVKKICADLNSNELDYYFLAPLIDRILGTIEEKEEDINEKDLYFYELKYSLSDYDESDGKKNYQLIVLQNIIEIKKILLFKWDASDKPDLGHYTSMKTVPNLISFGKDNYFRFTCASQLNDPLEGKVIFDFLNKAITTHSNGESNQISSPSNYTYFIASATSQSDSLPMWKQYTEDADGAYLTFSKDYLTRISQINGMKFGKICYLSYSDQSVLKCIIDNEENVTVTECLNKIFEAIRNEPSLFTVNNGLLTRLTEISFLFKRYEYSYESEYRIFIESSVEKLDAFDSATDYMKKEHQPDLTVVTEADGNPVPRLRIAITACPIVYESIKIGPKAINRDYVEPYVKACYKRNQELFNSRKDRIHYSDISLYESAIQFR
jgi:hypothetical protein